jgi:hypothetical protein
MIMVIGIAIRNESSTIMEAVLSFYCCSASMPDGVDPHSEARRTGDGPSARVNASALRTGLASDRSDARSRFAKSSTSS